MRDVLLNEIHTRAEAESLVEAVWLVGSMARGEEDPLSDLDLVLTAADDSPKEPIERLPTLAASVAPVALVHRAPGNAPVGGDQLNVLYDVSPLPLYVDWSVWPPQPRRPTDARVLFERDATRFETDGSFEEILADLPKGSRGEISDGYLNQFRVFMIPIVAKDAARGWTASVETMMKYMQIEAHQMDSIPGAIAQLRRILADHSDAESEVAISCVTRYLMQLELLIATGDRSL